MSPWLAVPAVVLIVALVLVHGQQQAAPAEDAVTARRIRRRNAIHALLIGVAFAMAVGLIVPPQINPITFAACWLLVALAVAAILGLALWDAIAALDEAQRAAAKARHDARHSLRQSAARQAEKALRHDD